MRKRILFVMAHPDDETFGPGGTIARYAHSGEGGAVGARGGGGAAGDGAPGGGRDDGRPAGDRPGTPRGGARTGVAGGGGDPGARQGPLPRVRRRAVGERPPGTTGGACRGVDPAGPPPRPGRVRPGGGVAPPRPHGHVRGGPFGVRPRGRSDMVSGVRGVRVGAPQVVPVRDRAGDLRGVGCPSFRRPAGQAHHLRRYLGTGGDEDPRLPLPQDAKKGRPSDPRTPRLPGVRATGNVRPCQNTSSRATLARGRPAGGNTGGRVLRIITTATYGRGQRSRRRRGAPQYELRAAGVPPQ